MNRLLTRKAVRSLLLVILAAACLLGVCIWSRIVVQKSDESLTYPPFWAELIASASRGNIDAGNFGTDSNQLNLSLLQPGDIILGGNPGGAYGRYTHAGIYVGDGQVIDMFISTGVHLADVDFYHQYKWAAILRVKASQEQIDRAVAYARGQLGAPFYILAPKRIDGLWYCTKLVWQAYREQGINLNPFHSHWIVPDALLYSPDTKLIDYAQAE
jgi:uncharacterized protein YycO